MRGVFCQAAKGFGIFQSILDFDIHAITKSSDKAADSAKFNQALRITTGFLLRVLDSRGTPQN